MQRIIHQAVILIVLLIGSLPMTMADINIGQPSISDEWRTLQTPHFNIHFVEHQRNFAQELAAIAEQVHTRLSASIGWEPDRRTEVVINDNLDPSNGMASPVPYNHSYLYLSPPSGGELMSHNHWLELLFTHEYTHTLHIDQVSGVPAGARKLFGRSTGSILPFFTFPQIWAPAWVAEGYAIHHESETGYGRGGSALYNAMMRQEVIKGITPLTGESYEGYSGSRWPFGQVYLYGSYLFDYIEQRYGKKKLRQYMSTYSRNWVPWRMSNRAWSTLGVTGEQLWRDFEEYLEQRFAPQIAEIESLGGPAGRVVASTPYLNRMITSGPDGSLFYYHYDASSKPEIRQLNADGTDRTAAKLIGVTSLRYSPRHGLMITQLNICDNTRLYNDLLIMDPEDGDLERITECQRILRTDSDRAGGALYGVQGGEGVFALVRIAKDGAIEVLDQLENGDVLGQISVSPDGGQIVASVKRLASGWNLERFDLTERRWSLLTTNPDLEMSPRFSSDGSELFFISDHGGYLNSRRMNLASGEVQTITNSLGYIAELEPSPGNGIWVVEYTGAGEVIRKISNPLSYSTAYSATAPGVIEVNNLATQPDFDTSQYTKDKEFSSLPTLTPTGWTPLLVYGTGHSDQVGLAINGKGVLGFHRWAAIPLFYIHPDLQEPGGLAYYDFYNRVILSASRDVDIQVEGENPGDDAKVYDIEDHLQLLAHYPINNLDWNLDLAVGSAWQQIERRADDPADEGQYEDTIGGTIISFSNAHRYLHSDGPTDGIQLSLTAESYDLFGSSDHVGKAFIGDFNGYLDLHHNHVLALDLLYAKGDDGIEPFTLHKSNDQFSDLGGFTKLGRREFALRGYPPSSELVGTHLARGGLAWRFPIDRIYDGFAAPPFGVGRIWGNLFSETGAAWDRGEDRKFYSSVGLELSAEVLIGFDSINIPITLGIAHGLDSELGESEVYFRLGIDYL
ncbi:MAG: hypothetical protein ABFS39_14955 [Pseudomonadota bacterium]